MKVDDNNMPNETELPDLPPKEWYPVLCSEKEGKKEKKTNGKRENESNDT